MKVKGTIIKELVRIVRKEKHKHWDPHFNSGDWDIINGNIAASAWYPGDFFYRLSSAVFKVSGNSDLDICFAYGQLMTEELLKLYRNILVPNDPVTSVLRFISRRKAFFGGDMPGDDIRHVAPGKSDLVVFYENADPMLESRDTAAAIAYSLAGGLHELVNRTGAGEVSTQVKGCGKKFEIHISWHNPGLLEFSSFVL